MVYPVKEEDPQKRLEALVDFWNSHEGMRIDEKVCFDLMRCKAEITDLRKQFNNLGPVKIKNFELK